MAAAEVGTAAVESGLDVLDLPESEQPGGRRRVARIVLPKVVAALVLLGVWQLAYSVHLKPDFIIPAPRDVWNSFADLVRQGSVAPRC